jgi:uncharacterized membrane protein
VEAGEGAVSRDTRIFALCLGALALIILGASTLTTVAIAHGASAKLRLPFLLMCHGIPHRCLTIFGTPMPICARCVAIYAGFIAGMALFPIAKRVEERFMKIVLAVAAVPIFIDGMTQAMGLRESTNPLRLATGLMVGAAFGSWVLVAIETRARQRFAES